MTSWLGYVSFGAGIIVALAIIFQLYQGRKTRQSELIANLSETWDSILLVESRQLARSFGKDGLLGALQDAYKANSSQWYILMRIPSFFNTMGAMVKHGDLPKKLVVEIFGTQLRDYWELYKNALTIEQVKDNSYFQALGEKIRR
jgi:hypothetical protein